jgi:hypothetical protein
LREAGAGQRSIEESPSRSGVGRACAVKQVERVPGARIGIGCRDHELAAGRASARPTGLLPPVRFDDTPLSPGHENRFNRFNTSCAEPIGHW